MPRVKKILDYEDRGIPKTCLGLQKTYLNFWSGFSGSKK